MNQTIISGKTKEECQEETTLNKADKPQASFKRDNQIKRRLKIQKRKKSCIH